MESDYIRNCIARAMAECAVSKQWELAGEFAEAVRIASRADASVAHQFLIELSQRAEKGEFSGR